MAWPDETHGGDTTFEGLTDTPDYLGNAGKLVQVNVAENALEYANLNLPIFNYDETKLNNTATAIAKMDAGKANMQVVYLSESFGGYEEQSGAYNYKWSLGYALAQILSKTFNVSSHSWMGSHGTSTIQSYDDRCGALPAGWTRVSIDNGHALYDTYDCIDAAKPQLTFSPKDFNGAAETTDTLEVYYRDTTSNDTIQVFGGAAGATLAAVVTQASYAGTNGAKKAVFTSAGTSVWKVGKATANTAPLRILGMSAYDSSKKRINILDCWTTAETTTFRPAITQSSSHGIFALPLSTPTSAFAGGSATAISNSPLVILHYGLTLDAQNVDATAFYTKAQAFITALKAAGSDVLLVFDAETRLAASIAGLSAPQQANRLLFKTKMYQLSIEFNAPLIDATVWGDRLSINNLGLTFNNFHYRGEGFTRVAAMVARFFNFVGGRG